jgi:hypothetical protein
MRFAIMAMLLVSALLAPASTMAAGEETVSAQVTVATPCITVGPNVNYGTLAFSTVNPFVQVSASGTTSYTNCSVTSEKVYMRGTNAVSASSSATWRPISASTCSTAQQIVDVYLHSVSDGTGGAFLSLSDQLLNPAAAAGATRTLSTQMTMPCSGSSGAGETMTFSIILTASF